jgi:dipeptidyl-peptidase-4
MDLGRVGITGWSFGGYMAAMAVLLRPDVFHAAIAGAPVTDWLDYDTHYTEHYMGHPEDNEAGYTESSALTYAGDLSRPLLIIHGTADDNVYFTHAVKLSDALLRAGIRHDFLPLSGSTHMVSDPAVRQQLSRWTVQFFKTHLSLRD